MPHLSRGTMGLLRATKFAPTPLSEALRMECCRSGRKTHAREDEYDHPLPIIKFGSHVATCGKANKIIKATTSAERNGTTPL